MAPVIKKSRIISLSFIVMLAVFMLPALKASAAVAPAKTTGLGFYGQDKSEFMFSWSVDPNLSLYGADGNFGFEVVVTSLKNKKLGTYDKNSIDNAYDSDISVDTSNNKVYMKVKNAKLAKQAFKFKVRAYAYDEMGNKVPGEYSNEKVIVPRANIKTFKAISRSSGKMTWQKVTGAKSYTIYVSSNGGTKFKKQGTTKSTSYTVKNMKLYKTYPVYVVANGVKYKKKKYNSTKPELKVSNASTIKIYLK